MGAPEGSFRLEVCHAPHFPGQIRHPLVTHLEVHRSRHGAPLSAAIKGLGDHTIHQTSCLVISWLQIMCAFFLGERWWRNGHAPCDSVFSFLLEMKASCGSLQLQEREPSAEHPVSLEGVQVVRCEKTRLLQKVCGWKVAGAASLLRDWVLV